MQQTPRDDDVLDAFVCWHFKGLIVEVVTYHIPESGMFTLWWYVKDSWALYPLSKIIEAISDHHRI